VNPEELKRNFTQIVDHVVKELHVKMQRFFSGVFWILRDLVVQRLR